MRDPGRTPRPRRRRGRPRRPVARLLPDPPGGIARDRLGELRVHRPADIPAASRRLVQDTAEDIYRALGCLRLARVDIFLTGDGRVVLNEVNTLPGLTSYSRYPRMMAAAGVPLSDVIDRLVSMALHGGRR